MTALWLCVVVSCRITWEFLLLSCASHSKLFMQHRSNTLMLTAHIYVAARWVGLHAEQPHIDDTVKTTESALPAW